VQEPDPEVVDRARRGDLQAFEAIVRACQADAWRFAYHLTGDRTAADDVTQEAFLRLFRSLSTYRGRSSFAGWFLRIVRNCAVDAWRRTSREVPTGNPAEANPAPRGLPPVEDRLRLRAAIGRLPPGLREAFVAIEVLGFSYREASQVLGTNVGTLKSRMFRARAALVRMLEEDGGEV
jgi:RNA polymerase sigma-70 factor (ECF subfamily)